MLLTPRSLVGVKGRVTVDQLLSRERDHLVPGQCPLALNVPHGAERPARASPSLVLDARHGSLLSPVKSIRKCLRVGGWEGGVVFGGEGRRRMGPEEDGGLEFGWREVCKVVELKRHPTSTRAATWWGWG